MMVIRCFFSNFALVIEKTKAIVLHTTKYNDQKVIVDLYTENFGRISCAVKIATTQRGKLKKQLFQPLTVLLIELDYRQSKPFQQLRDAHLLQPWITLSTDPVKMSVAMFIGEMLWHATKQEQGDSILFLFIEQSLLWLDVTDSSVANFHICFLTLLSRYLGIQPSGEDYQPTTVFDLRQGSFSFLHPSHSDFLKPADSSFVPLLLRMNYRTMHLFRFTRESRQQCLQYIIMYYRLHLPSFPEPRSLSVLAELFR